MKDDLFTVDERCNMRLACAFPKRLSVLVERRWYVHVGHGHVVRVALEQCGILVDLLVGELVKFVKEFRDLLVDFLFVARLQPFDCVD